MPRESRDKSSPPTGVVGPPAPMKMEGPPPPAGRTGSVLVALRADPLPPVVVTGPPPPAELRGLSPFVPVAVEGAEDEGEGGETSGQ